MYLGTYENKSVFRAVDRENLRCGPNYYMVMKGDNNYILEQIRWHSIFEKIKWNEINEPSR